MAESLSRRQHEMLLSVQTFIRRNGYPPTIRDLGLAMKIASPNGVVCHLNALERKGYITRVPGVSRGIVLTKAGKGDLE